MNSKLLIDMFIKIIWNLLKHLMLKDKEFITNMDGRREIISSN